MPGDERRRFLRLPVGRDLEYTVEGKNAWHFTTATKNLCEAGVCIIAFEKVEPGDMLDLRLALPKFEILRRGPKRIITMKGKVQWVGDLTVGDRKIEKAYEVGVDFFNLTESDRKTIQKYVENKMVKVKGR